jgi:hypothetical protein
MAVEEESPAGAAASASAAASPEEPGGSRSSRRAGVIDQGGNILKVKGSMEAAPKGLAKAGAETKVIKKNKDKLLRKAENLSLMDLGRIAMLKKTKAPVPSQWPPDAPAAPQHEAAVAAENAAAHSSWDPTCASAASSPPPSSATPEAHHAGSLQVKVECSSGSEEGADGVTVCPGDDASQ